MATDNSKPAAAAGSGATGRDGGGRVASAAVEELIINRWSPRSFSADPLSDAEIASLFEGARWAPSSFNGQPWLFLYETDGPDRPVFDSVLMPRNRAWASKAPLVGFIFANTRTPEGREPRTAQFDTGAAWMARALQARALGIYTHAMAGIDLQAAHDQLGVDAERYTVMCGFAAGRIGHAPRCPTSSASANNRTAASRSATSPIAASWVPTEQWQNNGVPGESFWAPGGMIDMTRAGAYRLDDRGRGLISP